jgi:hypothetical protein
LHLLPDEVNWSYLEQEKEGNWSFQGSEIKGKNQGIPINKNTLNIISDTIYCYLNYV